MRTRTEILDGATVVHVEGDVDVSSTLALRDTLAAVVGDGSARVVLDLAEVAFIDSAGIGLLVTAHRRAQAADGVFVLAALTPTVARVLELTRTDRLLRVVPSVEQGVVAVHRPSE